METAKVSPIEYVKLTNPKAMIESARERLKSEVVEFKKKRKEQGYNGFNRPVVYLAAVQKDSRKRGPKLGFYVDVIAFQIKGCHMQRLGVERAKNLGYEVIDFELPSRADYSKILAEQEASADENGSRFLDKSIIENFAELLKFCQEEVEAWELKLKVKSSSGFVTEMQKKADAAEARALEAEKELEKLKPKGNKTNG